MEDVIRIGSQGFRLLEQLHVGFCGRSPCLAMVARNTRADDVFPHMRAVSGARLDVVQGEVFRFFPTVLACEAIPEEYRPTRQPTVHQWAFDYVNQPYHRRERERLRDTANAALPVYQRLGLAATQQNDSPPCVANVKGLIVLI